jgi:hypothetical protein
MIKISYTLVFFILFPSILSGINIGDTDIQKTITISGYVSDAETGERLAGVTIIETNLKTGTSTNEYGHYSFSIPEGFWNLQLSYIGYKILMHSGQTSKNSIHDFTMERNETQLGEVVIEARRSDENVKAPSMGIVKLDIKTIS